MRADAQANRQLLLDTAWRLFAEQGPTVPLRTVAAEAGVGIATLYRNFATRQDLVLAMAEVLVSRVRGVAEAHDDEWATDPAAAWRGYVSDLCALRLGELGTHFPAIKSILGRDDRSALVVRSAVMAAVEGPLSRAREHGFVDPDLTAPRLYFGAAAISRELPPVIEEFSPGQNAWLVEVFLAGLTPRGIRESARG